MSLRNSDGSIPIKIPRHRRKRIGYDEIDWDLQCTMRDIEAVPGQGYLDSLAGKTEALDASYLTVARRKEQIRRQYTSGLKFWTPHKSERVLSEGRTMLVTHEVGACGCSRDAKTCWCNAYDDDGRLMTARERGKKWRRLGDLNESSNHGRFGSAGLANRMTLPTIAHAIGAPALSNPAHPPPPPMLTHKPVMHHSSLVSRSGVKTAGLPDGLAYLKQQALANLKPAPSMSAALSLAMLQGRGSSSSSSSSSNPSHVDTLTCDSSGSVSSVVSHEPPTKKRRKSRWGAKST